MGQADARSVSTRSGTAASSSSRPRPTAASRRRPGRWPAATLTIERTGGRGAGEDDLQEDHVVAGVEAAAEFDARGRERYASGPFSWSRYRRSAAAARSSSPTVSPVTGSLRSGATSASGPRTKKRSRKRGCGTVQARRSSTTSSPSRIRSRSSVRGAPGIRPLAAEVAARSRAARRAARARRARSRRPRRR